MSEPTITVWSPEARAKELNEEWGCTGPHDEELAEALQQAYAAGEAAGRAAQREAGAVLCEEGVVQIGCTALEGEGVVRRTRDALAAALRAAP